ncbi:glycosyltransferase [Flavobacterium aquidurense]|uniref:glycosyltransferase n=1 Tax=Flavobacterium aquidurense TaxID=362413 RepID=UPI002858714E|nr:glycosyltransferase [Flavobacterium aquidurense]MDR7369792.1 glycosyltransferase involved in cell wall biosynthesis [Flavobacterium aquidurense]
MKIVVVASFFPYPAYFGGANDVLERIKGLKLLGHDVDLVCTCKENPDEKSILFMKQFINELIIVLRKNKPVYIFYFEPLQAVSRKSLKKITFQSQYDYAILESESVGKILDNKSLKAKRIIVRVHNNESNYFKELSKSTKKTKNKIYYYLESLKFKSYSMNIFKRSDRLWFISNEEINNTIDLNLLYKSIHLPASVDHTFVNQKLSTKTVLYIGALFVPNNLEAIVWYLKKVHSLLLKNKNYKLIIVGSTGEFEPEKYKKIFANYSNVEVYLNQKELSNYYSDATVFVNPMLHGAGVKLKTINAIQNGLILVSSQTGVEGIGLIKNEMYFEANTPNDFANAIEEVFNMKIKDKMTIVENGQNFLSQNSYLSILKKEIQDEEK